MVLRNVYFNFSDAGCKSMERKLEQRFFIFQREIGEVEYRDMNKPHYIPLYEVVGFVLV